MIPGLTSNSRAHVTMTIEIGISDNWNSEATIDQVYRQAIESAKQKLIQINRGDFRIIGEPKVTMILVDKI